MRLNLAILTFAGVVGLADLQGWGHGYLGFLILVGWYFFLHSRSPQTQDRILAAMLVVSLLMLPLAVVQMGFMDRARGVFVSPNFLGLYAALNIFLALILLERRGGWLWSLALQGNIAMLLLSQSRGAIIAASLGGVTFAHGKLQPRHLAGLLFGAAVAVAILSIGRFDSLSPRFDIWRLAWAAALERPLLGWGQNGLHIGMTGLTQFYSVPLEWFVFTGILGVAAGAWMLFEAARLARGPYRGFLVAWFVGGLSMFTRPEASVALFTVLALLERRDVARVAVIVDEDQPLLHGGMRASGTD